MIHAGANMPFDISLSGLRASLSRLRTTSHNVANVATPGYKESRTDLVDQGDRGGVRVASVTPQISQGDVAFTNNSLDMGITGQGYFQLNDNGKTVYSRDGSFQLDREGYVVNARGQRLQAFEADANGNITGNLGDIQFGQNSSQPAATQNVDVNVSLSATDTAPTAAFNVNDPASYNFTTSTTVYDSLGNPQQMDLYFRQTGAPNTVEVHAYSNGSQVLPATNLDFSATGDLVSPANGQVNVPAYNPGTGAANMNITLNFSDSKQLGVNNEAHAINQDGHTSSQLSGLAVSSEGVVSAKYSDGSTATVGQVAMANFNNPQGLQSLGNNSFVETGASGAAAVAGPGTGNLGLVRAGALESSNVDLDDQMLTMIEAKHQFQANARMVKAESDMLGMLFDDKA
jgi:flagellar hook protein FlgE